MRRSAPFGAAGEKQSAILPVVRASDARHNFQRRRAREAVTLDGQAFRKRRAPAASWSPAVTPALPFI
jgi:hypothetical protein